MTLLGFRDVACVRGGRLLFAGIDLRIGAGEAVVLTGPNGVGKSSLLRIAAGLLRPASGAIERGGRLALLDERAGLDGERTLGAALRFWRQVEGGRDDAPLAGALAALGLAALAELPVRLLSTGQRRRAAMARVVASGAPLWLLDEPTSGFDAASVAAFGRLVAGHRASGGGVLVATHVPLDLPGAATVALAG